MFVILLFYKLLIFFTNIIIVRYIYGGRLSLEKLEISDTINIFAAANKLNLQELFPYLQSFLIENNAKWVDQYFNLVYQTSFESDSFLELQKYCTNFVFKEPDKIFSSLNISSIPERL